MRHLYLTIYSDIENTDSLTVNDKNRSLYGRINVIRLFPAKINHS